MINPFQAIINLLDKNSIEYQLIEHEPVFTCEQAAQIRGTSPSQGAKALLLKTNIGFILAIMPGDKRLDSKKFKNTLNVKDFRFATPAEVKEQMGCEVGACYPFGNLIDVKMVVDKGLSKSRQISFNPGVHNRSIFMKFQDYQKLVSPQIVNIVQ